MKVGDGGEGEEDEVGGINRGWERECSHARRRKRGRRLGFAWEQVGPMMGSWADMWGPYVGVSESLPRMIICRFVSGARELPARWCWVMNCLGFFFLDL